MEATCKAAGHADMDVLLALRREFCRHLEIAFDEQRARDALACLLNDQSLGRVWLIDSGGATVGYVVLIFNYSLEFDDRSTARGDGYWLLLNNRGLAGWGRCRDWYRRAGEGPWRFARRLVRGDTPPASS